MDSIFFKAIKLLKLHPHCIGSFSKREEYENQWNLFHTV